MKSSIFVLLFSLVTIPTMDPPISRQDSVKRVSPIKSCKVTKAEVEVYADFLRGKTDPKHYTALVTSTGARDYPLKRLNWQLAAQGHGIPPEIRSDFQTKNSEDCKIEPFTGVPNLKFISEDEEDNILAGGWTEFKKKYGKGSNLISVSRIGFNREMNSALLFAAGALYSLERKDKAWVIKWYVQIAAA
jgi:hypothetical protein